MCLKNDLLLYIIWNNGDSIIIVILTSIIIIIEAGLKTLQLIMDYKLASESMEDDVVSL